jgi:hypothetical protein
MLTVAGGGGGTVRMGLVGLLVLLLVAAGVVQAATAEAATRTSTGYSNGAYMSLTLHMSGSLVVESVLTIDTTRPDGVRKCFSAWGYVNGFPGGLPGKVACDSGFRRTGSASVYDGAYRWRWTNDFRLRCWDRVSARSDDPQTIYAVWHPTVTYAC